MKRNELYLEVDPKNQIILGVPKPLELNWRNIGGLPSLSEEQLNDLSWAGYENSGFVKFNKSNKNILRCFKCDLSTIERIKTELKAKITEIRYNYECGGVTIDNQYIMPTDDRSKLMINIKYSECCEDSKLSFNWKTSSGNVVFTSDSFIKVFKKIRTFIQNCFDLEYEIYKQIDKCETIMDLLSINIDSSLWNFNIIEL